jgi:branched-chain amino acid transport system permease protein
MGFASGYFKTSYRDDLSLVETRTRWVFLAILILGLVTFPFLVSPFLLDLASQVFIAFIGAVALMLLTGFAGQISLGHAGFIAAGAYVTAILFKEWNAPFWVTLPASGLVGAILGIIFGLPSLRLKGVYLALSTLAMHFIVVYLGSEYETVRGFATGIVVKPPAIGSFRIRDPRLWYFILLCAAVLALLFSINLVRSRSGRAWVAIRDREVVAEAIGVKVPFYKLSAFVTGAVMTSISGCFFAYYRGFVSVEAFSLFLTVQYVAMIIIGGLGTILGAVFGTIFVVLLPYTIDALGKMLHVPARLTTYMFAIQYASFGLIMIIFLVLEPGGLVAVWNRIRNYFILWPFKHKPLQK